MKDIGRPAKVKTRSMFPAWQPHLDRELQEAELSLDLNAAMPLPLWAEQAPVLVVNPNQLAALHLEPGIVSHSRGSVPNSSPPSKVGKNSSSKRSAAQKDTGFFPNTSMWTLPVEAVEGHSSYVPITCEDAILVGMNSPEFLARILRPGPEHDQYFAIFARRAVQGSKLWLACREGWVTGSIMGFILGFGQPAAADRLAITYLEQSSTDRAFAQVVPEFRTAAASPFTALTEIKMDWGKKHERSGVKTLRDNLGSLQSTMQYAGLKLSVCEQGLVVMTPTMWELVDEAVLDDVDVNSLPPIASSPDSVFEWRGQNPAQGVARIAVEVKAQCPFQKNTGRGEGSYSFFPLPPPSRITPLQLAQCHTHMLVLGVSMCLLIITGKGKAHVFEVGFNPVWCNQMLKQLQLVQEKYLHTKVRPPKDFGEGFKGHKEFVDLTIRICSESRVAKDLDSAKGDDNNRWMKASQSVMGSLE